MSESKTRARVSEMPAQRPSAPRGAAQERARFFNSGNAFNVQLPPVPDMVFTDQALQALDSQSPTGIYACDISTELGCAFPATTPLVIASYARIRAGDSLNDSPRASGVIAYVIQGCGSTECGAEVLTWEEGDLMLFPGGSTQQHRASDDQDVVLWVVSNEPQLAFERVQPPLAGDAPTEVVHYTHADISKQIDRLYDLAEHDELPGYAIVFSSAEQEASRNVLPTLTLAMNSIPGGGMQRPHRHNSVAVSLVVSGEGCYSLVDGRR